MAIFQQQKSNWLSRDGYLVGGGYNSASRIFAWLEKNMQAQRQTEIDKFIADLLIDESWISGNRGASVIALQMLKWLGERLNAAQKNKLESALKTFPREDYLWSRWWGNGMANTMLVRLIMAQFDPQATVKYGWTEDESTPQDFIWEGRSYKVGQRYNTLQLTTDWWWKWCDRYFNAEYLEGEMFTETYSYHFLNALITLADTRMLNNPALRTRAAETATLFLFEHGVNTNGKHLAGPLGRTYMNQHYTGVYMFFPFLPYFGFMPEVHYGNSNSYYLSEFRLPAAVTDFVCDQSNVTEIYSKAQGGRYVFITPDFSLGSSPLSGDWILQISGGSGGVDQVARPGEPFRLWLNHNPRDLDPTSCSGECYAEMGKFGFQYQNAILIDYPELYLHEAMPEQSWDFQKNSNGWDFKVRNNAAVALQRLPGTGAALEVVRLGVDEPNFTAFENRTKANAKFSPHKFITRTGVAIENREGVLFVNGKRADTNLPRLDVWRNNNRHILETFLDKKDVIPPDKPGNLRIEQ